jgi:hypothetical protein
MGLDAVDAVGASHGSIKGGSVVAVRAVKRSTSLQHVCSGKKVDIPVPRVAVFHVDALLKRAVDALRRER